MADGCGAYNRCFGRLTSGKVKIWRAKPVTVKKPD